MSCESNTTANASLYNQLEVANDDRFAYSLLFALIIETQLHDNFTLTQTTQHREKLQIRFKEK